MSVYISVHNHVRQKGDETLCDGHGDKIQLLTPFKERTAVHVVLQLLGPQR